jgi:Holliday junction resolvasome RuvABC endonuclease subunit
MKTLLALDPGSHLGWAYRGWLDSKVIPGGVRCVDAGTVAFERKRGMSSGMRFVLFEAWLVNALDETVKPEVVVYEMAHHRGGAATEALVGMTTIIQKECEKRHIEYLGVHTGTMKKAVLGSGLASKGDSVKYAEKSLGRKVEDDNEADAVCLLSYLEGILGEGK